MKKSLDGIIGLSVADAIGVPVEFRKREELKEFPVTGIMPEDSPIMKYSAYGMPAGTWSDDTSLTLATMDGIINTNGTIDRNTYYKIADNFVDYLYSNAFTPTGKLFDIGNTTRDAISIYKRTHMNPIFAGGSNPYNKGNGALMRILPIAYYAEQNNLPPDETITIVNNTSCITHRLPTCRLGSYIYTEFARNLLQGKSKEQAYNAIQNMNYSDFPNTTVEEYYRVLQDDISTLPEDEISSVGKTQETLEAALWCFMKNDDYKSTVLTAVNLGDDTDTVAAVAGGLAGIYYGIDNIPQEWKDKLVKYDYIENLCDQYDYAIQNKKAPSSYKPVEVKREKLIDDDDELDR